MRRKPEDEETWEEPDYEPEALPVAEAVPAPLAAEPAPAVMPLPAIGDRDALIEEMVAAQPDEANPFTSYKARAKRARIILAARELAESEAAAQPFDWRSYRSSREAADAAAAHAHEDA